MRIKKKHIFFAIAGIIALTFLLLSTLAIVVTNLDVKSRTDEVIQTLSRKINGHIDFQTAALEIFPLPCLVLDEVGLSLPEKVDASIRQVRIYPKISSLIRGKFRLSAIKLDFPQATVDIKWFKRSDYPLTLETAMARINEYQKDLAETLPGIRMMATQGKIDIIKADKQLLWVSPINADIRLSPRKIKIALDCRSSLWKAARFDISINPGARKTNGLINVDDFNIENFPDDAISLVTLSVSRLRTSLSLDFKSLGDGDFFAEIQGSIPELTLALKQEPPVDLSCNRIKGEFRINGNLTRITVDKLSMAIPRAELSGGFTWNREAPSAFLEIEGSVEDVASARTASLALIGRFKTTQKLFAIVRDGTVPHISFKSMAKSLRDFKKTENIVLKGEMASGKIVTPGSNLELEDVFGDVVMSKGALQGSNIRARLGNSHGTEGRFSIGMTPLNDSFFVETLVDADVSQIPTVLEGLNKNKALGREMGMIKNATGTATGKLILKGRKKAVKPRVEVDGFSVDLQYLRAPLPIHFKGGKFLYENEQIHISGMSGNMGQSTISNLAATFHWHDIPTLSGTAAGMTLVAEELYPWVTASPDFTYTDSPAEAVKGEILLSRTEVKGPLFHPAQWQFTTSGKTENMTVNADALPEGPVYIKGLIDATHDRLKLSSAGFSYHDTLLSGDCEVTDYLHTIKNLTADVSGSINPEILGSILSNVKLPFDIPKKALWTLANGKLDWRPRDKTFFEGTFTVPGGPDIFLDLCHTDEELTIHNIHIKDDDSDAAMAVHRKGKTFDITFNGRLSPDSLEHFFNCPPLVAGNFQLNINLLFPENAVFSGEGELYDLDLSQYANFPVTLYSAFITGGNGPPVIRAWGKMNDKENFILDGTYLPGIDRSFSGRFDISFDDLDLNAFLEHLRSIQKREHGEKRDRFYKMNATWDLNIAADRLDFGKYSWVPVTAHVNILPDNIHVEVENAQLCGVNTPGTLDLKPDGIQFDFHPKAENTLLETVVPCLGGKSGLIKGDMDITGTVSAKGPYDRILPALNGNFTLSAKNGRIHRFGLIAKIFSILNITEIYRGTLPDLTREGFQYTGIEAAGTLSGEKIIVTKAMIDGEAMDMVFEGDLNIKDRTMDMTFLVAPLKTVDTILKNTPIVGDIFGGSLVTIAIDVKGDIADPELTPLPPSAIGGGFLKIIENTLKIPIKIIQPVFEQKKEDDNGNKNN